MNRRPFGTGALVGATALAAAGLAAAPERPVLATPSEAAWRLAAREGALGAAPKVLAPALEAGAPAQIAGIVALAAAVGAAAALVATPASASGRGTRPSPAAAYALVASLAAPGVVSAARGAGPDVWIAALVAGAAGCALAAARGSRALPVGPLRPIGSAGARLAWGGAALLFAAAAVAAVGPPGAVTVEGAGDAIFGTVGLPVAIGAALALVARGGPAIALVGAAAVGMGVWPERAAGFVPLVALAGAVGFAGPERDAGEAARTEVRPLDGLLPLAQAVLTLWLLLGVRGAVRSGGPDPREALAWLGLQRFEADAPPEPGHDHAEILRPSPVVTVDLDPEVSPDALTLLAPPGVRFVSPEEGGTHALALRRADTSVASASTPSTDAPPRDVWRTLLPPATATLPAGEGWNARLWDRPLPPETLLTSGSAAAHHPRSHALWTRARGGVAMRTSLAPASSAAVVEAGPALVALFVRDQALWRATSPDGLTWSDIAPLGVPAFDPAPVRLPDGTWRVYAVELVNAAPTADPARVATRIVSFRAPADLSSLAREPGERFAGDGIVDPSVATRPGGTVELWFTEGGARIGRATSTDGLTFTRDAAFALDGATVPEVAPGWLVAQYPSVDRSVLYVHARRDDGSLGPAEPLELCGTGASVARDRVFWTADDAACGPPHAFPERAPAWPPISAR